METNYRNYLQNCGDSLILVLRGSKTIDLFFSSMEILVNACPQTLFQESPVADGGQSQFLPHSFQIRALVFCDKFLTAK